MTPDKDTGIGVRVEIDQEIIVLTVLEVETETEMDGCNKEPEVLKYSLEQYIGFVGRQAFIHYCGLHQVWLEAEI